MLDDHDGPEAPDPIDDEFGIPVVVPPLPVARQYARQMPVGTVMHWLRAGWRDLWTNPLPSLLYGLLLFGLSVLMIWLLYRFNLEHTVFPALAGFMVLGPLIANGLYVKSRNLELGQPTSFMQMILVQPRSAGSSLFMGVILLMLFMLWIRAAIIIWAIFFGIAPFPGMNEIVPMLFTTAQGWALLVVGGAIGALFAAFAFAISVFAVPMLLEERTDALSALGISMAMVWNNRKVMIAWGFVAMCLFTLSVVTALVGLILIFPLLGHATWHAYRSIRPAERQGGESEDMYISPGALPE